MDELAQPRLETPADYEAEIDRIIEELNHLHERMAHDQAEIEESRARTRAILTQLKAA